MRFLVDTHLLIWQVSQSERLTPSTRELIADSANAVVFSVVSLWEIVIKTGLPRNRAFLDPNELRDELLASGYLELEVGAQHVLEVAQLEPIHADPFDRLLLAQARVEGLVLLTGDERLLAYGYPAQRA